MKKSNDYLFMKLNILKAPSQLNIDLLKGNSSLENIYYYSALVFAFSLPLSRAAISFFIIWFVLLFILQRDYKQAWNQMKNIPALKAIGLFIAFLFLSIIWSEDTAVGLKQMRLYSYWIIIPILAIKLKKEWLSHIITAFLLGMLLSELIAYGIFFELWTLNGRTPEYPSPFMFHIHYSLFLAITAIILINRLFSKSYSLTAKLPMLLFFLTSAGNLFISTGRTGQFAFFIAMGIAIIIHYRLTIKSLFTFLLLSFILFFGAYKTIPLFEKRANMAISDIKKLQNNDYRSSWGLRAAFWVVTYDILKKDPLIGVGIGDYELAAKTVLKESPHNFNQSVINWCTSTHFHNQYLMTLVQIGLIGFGLMLWLFISLLKLNIHNKELKELSILVITVFLVSCIAEPMWMLQFPIILFVFIVSISIAGSQKVLHND